MLPPDAIFELKIHQNVLASGALTRTPLGSLQCSPYSIAGFQGPLCGKGGEERREKGREGEGSVPPLLFKQFNYWL